MKTGFLVIIGQPCLRLIYSDYSIYQPTANLSFYQTAARSTNHMPSLQDLNIEESILGAYIALY